MGGNPPVTGSILILDSLFDDLSIEIATAAARGWSLARWDRSETALRSADVAMHVGTRIDRDLFERLRAVRLDIARSRNVPPYVIFHDATLREMARLKPGSKRELLAVKGVGARKAEDLGDTFLDAIRNCHS
jgi:superfamily II DNA helicase RecQ